MFAKLSALVSGGPQLPYDLADANGERTSGGWTHHSGTSKADKSEVSVFKYSFSPGGDDRRTEAARHGVKSLRTVSLTDRCHMGGRLFDAVTVGVMGIMGCGECDLVFN